ncbi:hypothetical protein NDO41_06840 [Ectopseudomonas mendocina]|nr:hypothetical protein NDO41_06840 [Pseudomonas mendocina]
MTTPSNAADAIQLAETKLAEIRSMEPLATISISPAKAQCRLAVMELTGMVLNGYLPPANQKEADRASELYAIADQIE